MGVRKMSPINAKMKVLREFGCVTKDNEKDVRLMLELALRRCPHDDPELVLDRAAKPLIEKVLFG